MKVVAIILASGKGERTGSYIPKQYMKLNGKIVVEHAAKPFLEAGLDVALAVNPEHKEYYQKLEGRFPIIEGGATREKTVDNCRYWLMKQDYDYVIFHDSVRPFVTVEFVRKILESFLQGSRIVLTAPKITDSLVTTAFGDEILWEDREFFRLIQTPECFCVSTLIRGYFTSSSPRTAIIASPLFEQKIPITLLEPDFANFKITYRQDLDLAESLLAVTTPPEFPEVGLALQGKRILVLGGSGGIGKRTVEHLTGLGAEVVAPTRVQLDLSNPNLVQDLHWRTERNHELFDHVVNLAGVCFEDKDGLTEKFQETYRVNLEATLALLTVAPDLVSPGGSILVIGSSSSTYGREGFTLYSSSKAALNSVVQAMAPVLNLGKIRLNCLCPCKVDAGMIKKTDPYRADCNILSVDFVAETIAKALIYNAYGQIWHLRKGYDK